jgi:hypothetical protein
VGQPGAAVHAGEEGVDEGVRPGGGGDQAGGAEGVAWERVCVSITSC